jgi:predicted small lipoprotein YifL
MIEETAMKKLIIFLIFLLTFAGCGIKGGKSFSDLEQPDAFCEVIQKPDPLLMGTWEGHYTRTTTKGMDKNYIKYRLIEYDGKYALYFYRTWQSGQKKVKQWKKWTINGQEISAPGGYGVKIFVRGSDVYFTIRGIEEPVKMSRGVE